MDGGLWTALGENPSATVVLAVFVVLLALGLFTPRWLTNAMLKAKDQEIDRWREAWGLSEEARREEASQTAKLLEASDMHTRLLESIRDAAARKDAT